MAAPSPELANRISGGIVTSALCSVRGEHKQCHSAILVLFILYSECRTVVEEARSLADFPSKGSIPRNPGRGYA